MKRVTRSLFLFLALCYTHTSNAVISIKTVEEFERLKKEGTPMVVQFFAPWCEACKMIGGQYRQVAKDHLFAHITFATVNTDQAIELSETKKVESVPTFFLIADGKIKSRIVGIQDPDNFGAFLCERIQKKLPAPCKSRYKQTWDSTKGFFRNSIEWMWNSSKKLLNKVKGLFGF